MCYLTIQDLVENFTITGKYYIKLWDRNCNIVTTVAEGEDLVCEYKNIKSLYMNAQIDYMYAVDEILVIEIEI